MEKQMQKKSGSGVIIFIFIIIVAGVVASNFVGPGKGWLQKFVQGEPKEEKTVKTAPQSEKPVEKPKVVETKPEVKKAEPEKKAEKSEVQKLYDELFAKYRKKYPDPEKGKKYTVYLKSGIKLSGKLKDFSDGRVVIQKPGVTATYRLDVCSKKSYPKLFPKKAAKILALRDLKKILDERAAAEEAKLAQQEYMVEGGKVAASNMRGSSSKPFSYDPEPGNTPLRLKKPLQAFGDWVMVQQRRIGGKIADKIYAKQQGSNVVLYVQTSKLFRQQDYDVRFTVTEGMWQIWGFKCLDYGAARATGQTHVVLLDKKQKIIGGSTKKDSSNIWVKK